MGFDESLDKELLEARLVELLKGKCAIVKIMPTKKYIFLQLSPFKVGAHKRNVLPQNHFQDITLNDHYIYKIIYLVYFLSSFNTHIFYIKMLVIFFVIWMIKIFP
jgi:hypothetical protein